MSFLRLLVKRGVMVALSFGLFLYGQCVRRSFRKEEVRNVGILFLPILGIGDLVMLSPVIEALQKMFPHATVTLVTWVPHIQSFSGVNVVHYSKISWKTHTFDCVISPTLNIRHIPYLWRARYWIGFFSAPRIQSNCGLPRLAYDMRNEHYLWRGIRLLTAIEPTVGTEYETLMQTSHVTYPTLFTNEPALYSTAVLGTSRYAVVGIFSKWEDRQWSYENFATVIKELYEKRQVEKIVIIGDKSEHNVHAAKRFISMLALPNSAIVNATGLCTLAETNFLIARCHVYIGLDSGPAHLAYLLAPRSVVLFVTVPPALRLPRTASSRKIATVYIDPPPPQPLYTGHGPVSATRVRQAVQTITIPRVRDAIQSVIQDSL